MGRGQRTLASGASQLLYGPRNQAIPDSSDGNFIAALQDNDFKLAQVMLDIVSDRADAEEQLRKALVDYGRTSERGLYSQALNAFGIRSHWADTIIIENEHTQKQILHFSHEAKEELDDTLGGVTSPSVTTACGKTIGPKNHNDGSFTGDGGRALKSAWQNLPEFTSHCPDCAKRADDFPESQIPAVGDGQFFPGVDERAAALIDLAADDPEREARHAYHQALAEVAAAEAVSGGEYTMKRLYGDKYRTSSKSLLVFNRDLAPSLSQEQWQQALLSVFERGDQASSGCIDDVDQMLTSAGLPPRYRD